MAAKEKEIKVYKIRHRDTGLWSKGGSAPTFNKVGKTWSNIGHVKSHLSGMYKVDIDEISKWEIVEFVMKPEEREVKNVISDMQHYWFAKYLEKTHTELRSFNETIKDERKMSNKEFAFVYKTQQDDFFASVVSAINEMGLEDDVYISPRTYYTQLVLCKDRETAMKVRLVTDGAIRMIDLKAAHANFRKKYKLD